MTQAKPLTQAPASQPVTATSAPAPARRLGLIFAVICGGFAMSNLDMMIVNVAFPAIERDFAGSSTADLSWSLSGYSIVFAALLVPFGRLADRSSRKAGFMLGLAVFTLASALCAAAQNVPMLVGARVLQAAGAAALVPTALGLLLAAFPAEKRAAAISGLTAIGGVGVALAPIIGGSLANVDWRWIFLINLPIGVLSLIVGQKVLPAARIEDRTPLPDLLGSLLLIVGVGLLALGVVKAPEWHWSSGRVLGSLAGAAVFVTLFLLRSARHPSPVVSFDLWRIPSFSLANLASILFALCFSSMLLSFMLWSQTVWGFSALKTGIAYAPGTFLMPFVAILAGRLAKKIGAGAVIAIGCTILTAGVIWWAVTATIEHDYLFMLLPGAILTPIGSIMTLTTVIAVVTKDLPPTAFATGSAVNTMVRQIGFVVGVSAFVAALGTATTPETLVPAFQHGWTFTAICGAAAVLVSLFLVKRTAPKKASS
jgi:EmrB/QacA subfamily drug resistance transporter